MQFCGINQFPINFTPEGLTKRTRSARYFNSITLILFCVLTFGACHKKVRILTGWVVNPLFLLRNLLLLLLLQIQLLITFVVLKWGEGKKKKMENEKKSLYKADLCAASVDAVCLFVRLSSQVSINRNSLCLCLKDLVGPGEKEKTN